MTITVACCLWKANEKSQLFSQCYDESWADKLYRAFRRHLTWPHRFVCFVDQVRKFGEPGIQQMTLRSPKPYSYGAMIEPYLLDGPLIVCGLDTLVIANINHLGFYCMTSRKIALPRDPYQPTRSINGVVLVPKGHQYVYHEWRGENDMEYLRRFDGQANFLDDLWPGEVISFKAHKVRTDGVGGARIIYFHGTPKPHQLLDMPLIKEHWV